MSTTIAVREQQMTVLTNEQLQYIANTEFVPAGLRGNLPAILAAVATGRALGIADMTALRSIHVIDGKATFSAELMVQLVRRAGHSITGEVTAGSATVTGTRKDNGDTMTSTWTLDMADRAGLLGKSNWKKYPEAMLWARAASQLCRMLFADCFAGATYTTEELGDEGVIAPPYVEDPAAGTPFTDLGWDEPADRSGVGRDPAPVPSEDADPLPPSEGAAKQPSAAMLKKLNVLVGKLRPDHLSTLQLWQSMGKDPHALGGYNEDDPSLLHWSPLRDSLTWQEAHDLIDRLEAYAKDKLKDAA